MKTRYQVIENKRDKAFLVIDTITGVCLLDTENPETAKRKAQSLNNEDNI